MAGMEKRTLEGIYRRAERPEDLPWHREDPWPLLVRAVEGRGTPGRALDLGCGAGVYATWLAEQGYDVTGVDYLQRPLEMAEARAREHGVQIRLVQADVTTWEESGPYDLILDSGCLHSLPPSARADYKRQLLKWLAPDGDYVLVHFGKRHAFDWRPIGPRRRPREFLIGELGPELAEKEYEERIEPAPLPIGPVCKIGFYRFRRA